MVSFPRRGEVYWALLDALDRPGQAKMRPAIVVQNDLGNQYSPSTIVVPLSSRLSRRDYPFQVLLPEGLLPKPSRAKCERVTTLDKNRLKPVPLAVLDAETMAAVDAALKVALGIS
jgi:mRNA interferase MazF